MTSQRRIAANQRNARRGHGPRTAAGKAHARKHGLSIPIKINQVHDGQELEIARAIAGEKASSDMLEQSCIITECELDIQRAKQARSHAMTDGLPHRRSIKQRSADACDHRPTDEACNNPESVAQMFVRALPQLRQIKRYESRAYARRNKAMTRLEGLRLLSGLWKSP